MDGKQRPSLTTVLIILSVIFVVGIFDDGDDDPVDDDPVVSVIYFERPV